MAFFWWLSSLSPWPWLTLIGLMAAPVLSLRSPESVAAGKEMLGRYWENKKVSTGQAWLTGLVAVGLAAGLSYWGAQHFARADRLGGVLVRSDAGIGCLHCDCFGDRCCYSSSYYCCCCRCCCYCCYCWCRCCCKVPVQVVGMSTGVLVFVLVVVLMNFRIAPHFLYHSCFRRLFSLSSSVLHLSVFGQPFDIGAWA